MRVWWRCDQCPCGLGLEWMATVDDRQHMNHQCPFCTNKRLCQHNSLLNVAPAVAAYWDKAKNGLTSDQVKAYSHARKHWLCPSCNHSWQTRIHIKVDHKSGCPNCSNKLKGYSRQPSLTQCKHPAMLGLILRGTAKQVSILTRSQQEVPRWCTGYVPIAPKINLTCWYSSQTSHWQRSWLPLL